MTITMLISQMLLTIPLTIILNFIERKNIGKIAQVLIPSIYMIIIAAFLPELKQNIFLIVIFEIFIRNFYISNIVSQNKEDTKEFLLISFLSALISLIVYNYFLNVVSDVLPNPEEIKPFIWFLIIVYLINIYQRISLSKTEIKKEAKIKKNKEYLIMQYAKFKNKYHDIVKSKNKIINDMTYAIMIYESCQIPQIYRKANEYIGAITKKETPYGIMRVKSFTHLTDEESIKIVINDLEKNLKQQKEKIDLAKLLKNYSQEELNNIIEIYKEIVEFTNK